MLTLALADDMHMVRQGVRALLENEADFSVVGEASDGAEAIELAVKLRPNILLVDMAMPRIHGLEVIKQVRRRAPETRVLVLSTHANESYVIQALKGGASGYILKDEPAAKLVQAVRDVHSGRHYLSPALSERAIQAYVSRQGSVVSDSDALTAREQEILHLVAEGRTNAQIADRLSISVRTVETHRANLMRKLGLKTKTDLIRYALEKQAIHPS